MLKLNVCMAILKSIVWVNSIYKANPMRVKLKFLILFLCSTLAAPSWANRIEFSGKITRLYTYSEQFGFDGDVAIIVNNSVPGCEGGFWLRKASTEGYKNTFAFLLSAFHANTTVQFGALTNEPWAGATNKFCRIDQISLLKS
jgi:hypothetical protein